MLSVHVRVCTVDMEEDINAVTSYFSYEHFYVLYCKFWELDTDHDFLLSRYVCQYLYTCVYLHVLERSVPT